MTAALTRGVWILLAGLLWAGPVQGQATPLPEGTASRAVEALEALNEAGLLAEGAEPQPSSEEANLAANIIRSHGFSPSEWMAALHGVTDGYVALKAGRLYAMPGAEEEFQAMRQGVLDNPNIDEKTREQALLELDRRLGPQAAESPLAEVVAPYEARLDAVFQDGVTD
jgi:hypothetical protein